MTFEPTLIDGLTRGSANLCRDGGCDTVGGFVDEHCGIGVAGIGANNNVVGIGIRTNIGGGVGASLVGGGVGASLAVVEIGIKLVQN